MVYILNGNMEFLLKNTKFISFQNIGSDIEWKNKFNLIQK